MDIRMHIQGVRIPLMGLCKPIWTFVLRIAFSTGSRRNFHERQIEAARCHY